MSILGEEVIAMQLAKLGVQHVFGVVGIPVVGFSQACQRAGVHFYSLRNEQAASYAAATYGYLTGRPGVCLCVSGPGVVHALAGVANAQVNAWPMILLGGSHKAPDNYRGAFQEGPPSHQLMVAPFVKFAATPVDFAHMAFSLTKAHAAALGGRPGAAYIELHESLLTMPITAEMLASAGADASATETPAAGASAHSAAAAAVAVAAVSMRSLPLQWLPRPLPVLAGQAAPAAVFSAAALLASARRPLLMLGKGACASAAAPAAVRALVDRLSLPFLPAPMAKGLLPDDDAFCAGAARSLALARADIIVLAGTRLNWMLRHGAVFAPGARVIQIDVSAEELGLLVAARGHHAPPPAADMAEADVALVGDVGLVLAQLSAALTPGAVASTAAARVEWAAAVRSKAVSARAAVDRKIAADLARSGSLTKGSSSKGLSHKGAEMMGYHAALGVVAAALPRDAVLVSEGANTMDMTRLIVPSFLPRRRLDAGTFATMGPSLGAVMAAHVAYGGDDACCGDAAVAAGAAAAAAAPVVVGVFGDSSFGFAAVEIESLARYRVPAVIIVVNNNGIYSGNHEIPNALPSAAATGVATSAADGRTMLADAGGAMLSPYATDADAAGGATRPAAAAASAATPAPASAPLGLAVAPTALTPRVRYDAMAVALGADPALSCTVAHPDALRAALKNALALAPQQRLPVVINVLIAPEGNKQEAAAKLQSSDAFFGKKLAATL